MTTMIIFFDLDGVLADFDRGLRELCDFAPCSVNEPRTAAYEEAMWAAIRAVPHFYARLQPMPGALEMFSGISRLAGVDCEILTGIPKPKRGIATAAADKTEWVRRCLSPDVKLNIVMREDKPLYCRGRDCLLIDDTRANIEAWEAMGGTGILHVTPGETAARVRHEVQAVADEAGRRQR